MRIITDSSLITHYQRIMEEKFFEAKRKNKLGQDIQGEGW
ncbi:hypothetical protein BRIN106911_15780 [Brevibacillus invocatus]